MAKKLQPIPKQPQEIIKELVGSPSEPTLRGERVSANESDVKNISITLDDIDGAILYYFENVLKPAVMQNNNMLNVPVMFSTPEQWHSVQKQGALRDKNGKLMLPLITLNKVSIKKDKSIGNKLDGNRAHLFQSFEVKYNRRNTYDRFTALQTAEDEAPKQYFTTVVPDYVDITYKCSIMTEYVTQNNRLVEAIEYASDSYWGDEKRFKFRTSIDTFTTTTSTNIGEDRVSKTDFTLLVKGYIIPESINQKLSAPTSNHFQPNTVSFNEEVIY